MEYNSIGYKTYKVFSTSFMVLLSVIMLFPFLNVMAYAFNEGNDSMLGGITVFPRVPTLENFRVLFRDPVITGAVVVSISRVLLGTGIALFVQFCAAYALTKKRLKGRNAIIAFFLIPMFFSGGLIPVYLLYSKIGILNNFLVYIIPTAFSFYNVVIIRTYMHTIPISLEESAKLDGANEFTILFRIVLPLSMPIIATISLWTAVFHWNDWTTTLYFITKSKLYTLQYLLMQILKESEKIIQMIQLAQEQGINAERSVKTTPEAIKAAQVVVTSLPIIMVYPFLQKYFIKGVMIGAIKE